MSISTDSPFVLRTPPVAGLDRVVAALRSWQRASEPFQLHPGDLGWFWRFGPEATAAAVRTWCQGDDVVCVGLVDDRHLFLAIAPERQHDSQLAHQLVADVSIPQRGVLREGEIWVEPPSGPGRSGDRTAVQRASFVGSTFTDERWQAMTAGVPYADARCLVAYSGEEVAVAAVTVWSAGPGRPGLIEPMGVHRDHRGRGFGRSITLAAAAELRLMGASSALVCTPSSNIGAVATYQSAGFRSLAEIRALVGPATRSSRSSR